MPYPHQTLLQESGLKKEDLSSDLQILIDDFEKKEKLAKEKETTEEKVDVLTAQSNVLAQTIYDYYVDSDDQTVEITVDATPATITEAADEIKEEIKKEEQEKEKTEESAAGEGLEGKSNEPEAEESVQPIQEEIKKEEPKSEPAPETDPVTAAIAAGAAKPEESQIKSKEAQKTEPKVELFPNYSPMGDEKALYDLYLAGKKENLSKKELHEAGLNTGFFGNLESEGGAYGKFLLRRVKGTSNYNLILR